MDKERMYTIVVDDLSRIVGAEAAMIAGKVAAWTTQEDECTISLPFLAELLGNVSVDTVRRQLQRLQLLGYIEYQPQYGRGAMPIFKKGANLLPFIDEKGRKNTTFSEEKRSQKSPEKVANFGCKDYNKIIKATHAHGCVRAAKDAAAGGEQGNGSPQQGEEKRKMEKKEQFEKWWSLSKIKDDYLNRKDRCENVWFGLSDERRAAFLKAAEACKKHRDNPLHYLQYDTPEDAKDDFPIFVNGNGSLVDAIKDAENGGRALAFVRAGATLHTSHNFAHIYLADALEHKIKVIRTIPRSAILHVPEELKEK